MHASGALTAMARRRNTGLGGAFLVALLALAGCAGMEPYKPYNYREEGPEKGIFTGSEGQFEIFSDDDVPKADWGGFPLERICDSPSVPGEEAGTQGEEPF